MTLIKSVTAASGAAGPLLLNCPRCGLSIRPRVRWLAIAHCPRCLATARIPVRLNAYGIATRNLHDEHASTSTGRPGIHAIERERTG